MRHEAPRCSCPWPQDTGRDSDSGCGKSPGGRKPGGRDPDAGLYSKLHLHLAGQVSRWRVGCAEGPRVEGAAPEGSGGADALAVSNHYRQESPAVSFRVCAVDAGHDPGSAAGAVSIETESGECGAATEAIGADVSASVVPGDGARSGTGAAVAGAGISGDSRTGPEGRGGNLLWR